MININDIDINENHTISANASKSTVYPNDKGRENSNSNYNNMDGNVCEVGEDNNNKNS